MPLLLALTSCEPSPREGAVSALAQEVSVNGFRARLADGAVWVDRDAPLELLAALPGLPECPTSATWQGHDGTTSKVRLETRRLPGKTRIRILPPEDLTGSGTLELQLCARRYDFRVEVGPAPRELPQVQIAEQRFRSQDRAGALTALRAPDAASARLQLQLAAQRASILQRSGSPETQQAWLDVARLAERHGVVSERGRAIANASFAALMEGRLNRADELLDQLQASFAQLPQGAPREALWYAQYRSMLASRTGRLAEAHQLLQDAIVTAESIGEQRTACGLREELANVQLENGLLAPALVQLEDAHACHRSAQTENDATRMRLHNSRGWFELRRMAEGAPNASATRIRSELEQAARLAESLGEPLEHANILTNLAWLAVLERRFGESRQTLAKIAMLDPRQRAYTVGFAQLVAARAALETGEARSALSLFRALVESPQAFAGAGPDLRPLALAGVAQSLEALGKTKLSVDAYYDAVHALHDSTRHTLVFGARDRFYVANESVVRDLVSLLMRLGRNAEAFWVLDGARERTLHALSAKQRLAGLSGPALAKWRDGLEQARRAADQARQFEGARPTWPRGAQLEQLTRLQRLQDERDAALERAWALLGVPESPSMAGTGAPKAFVELSDDEAVVAVHASAAGLRMLWATKRAVRAWPLNRARLLEVARQVGHVYLLPTRSSAASWLEEGAHSGTWTTSTVPSARWLRDAARATRFEPTGLQVFADPTGDLPQARLEAVTLRAHFPHAHVLTGEAVTKQSMLRALRGTSMIHYAGHMRGNPAALLSERLPLAGRDSLGIQDLLPHDLRSPLVVLSACGDVGEVALGDPNTVGLGEAITMLGGSRVVTTIRSVGDDDARAFMDTFYTGLAHGESVAFALRQASQSQQVRGNPAWDAFRLVGLR